MKVIAKTTRALPRRSPDADWLARRSIARRRADVAKAASFFKLLSDPTRVRMLYLLSRAPGGLCVYEIAESLGVSHSAASHQLSKLEARGIVECFRQGQSVCYELKKTAPAKKIITVIQSYV